jgi:hypothetical protein
MVTRISYSNGFTGLEAESVSAKAIGELDILRGFLYVDISFKFTFTSSFLTKVDKKYKDIAAIEDITKILINLPNIEGYLDLPNVVSSGL